MIQERKEFCFIGSRNPIRTEEEMSLINKEEAELFYKQYKKEIIDRLLLNRGFCKYKTNAYVRLNSIGLLEYIDLQKERYGSKTFCVNFAAMPLYCERKYIVISLGHRLGTYISGKDVWWDYAAENVAKEWLDALENMKDKEALIQQSIMVLKLPKKIQR